MSERLIDLSPPQGREPTHTCDKCGAENTLWPFFKGRWRFYKCEACGEFAKGITQTEWKERNKFIRARELAEAKAEFRRKQIAKNVAIAKSFSGIHFTLWTLDKLRRNLAVYRLHQYCDLSEKQISKLLGVEWKISAIKLIIGSTYRFLCVTNESCVLRFMFLGGVDVPQKFDAESVKKKRNNK